MQTIIITFFFGAACTMVLWAAGSAAVMRDQLMRQYGLSPAREI